MKRHFSSLFLPSFFFLLSSSFSLAQTVINGTTKDFANKEIRLYTYKDYITKSKLLVESTLISGGGNFKFSLPENISSGTFYAMFKIENFVSTMYIEQNTVYEISIEKPDSAQFYNEGINYIDAVILKPEQDLNAQLRAFYYKYYEFTYKNQSLFIQKSAKAQVDSFKNKMNAEYDKNNNFFLKTHIKFALASLELVAAGSRQNVFSEYVSSSPVEYGNDSYMQFFNEFYKKQLDSFSGQNTRNNLLKAINEKKSYAEAMNTLSNEFFLNDAKIRELVLIKCLYENYRGKEFDKKSISYVLKEIVKTSPVGEHREIAMNVLHEIEKLNVGAKAPDFALYDKNEKLIKLSDFRGKYVYLDFWATWCVPCLKEMPKMEELHKKYGKNIIFISISIDKDFKTMEKFLSKKKSYDWIFLHYGAFQEVKDLYNVLAIPLYYLIDPEGIIVQSPAYRPNGKTEETFMHISTGKKTKRKPYEWDW